MAAVSKLAPKFSFVNVMDFRNLKDCRKNWNAHNFFIFWARDLIFWILTHIIYALRLVKKFGNRTHLGVSRCAGEIYGSCKTRSELWVRAFFPKWWVSHTFCNAFGLPNFNYFKCLTCCTNHAHSYAFQLHMKIQVLMLNMLRLCFTCWIMLSHTSDDSMIQGRVSKKILEFSTEKGGSDRLIFH